MKLKIIILSILAVLVLAVAGVFVAYSYFGISPQSMVRYMFGPEYKEATKYSTGGAGYVCSKPIKLQKETAPVLHLNGTSVETHYLPVDPEEAKSLCTISWLE